MSESDPQNSVYNWFDDQFCHLHPQIQKLHLNGGKLAGDVTLTYGKGIRGILGRIFAKTMNVPPKGIHSLTVHIFSNLQYLHWNRRFKGFGEMHSTFTPVGSIKDGYWIEKTGSLTLHLGVDIIEGEWHWRTLRALFLGIPIPILLLPKLTAYKLIEEGSYRFYVGLSWPILGNLFSYSGLLTAQHQH